MFVEKSLTFMKNKLEVGFGSMSGTGEIKEASGNTR